MSACGLPFVGCLMVWVVDFGFGFRVVGVFMLYVLGMGFYFLDFEFSWWLVRILCWLYGLCGCFVGSCYRFDWGGVLGGFCYLP